MKMRYLFYFLILSFSLLSACKKEEVSLEQQLIGEWKFIEEFGYIYINGVKTDSSYNPDGGKLIFYPTGEFYLTTPNDPPATGTWSFTDRNTRLLMTFPEGEADEDWLWTILNLSDNKMSLHRTRLLEISQNLLKTADGVVFLEKIK